MFRRLALAALLLQPGLAAAGDYLLMVFLKAAEQHAAEFADWYDHRHMPEVLQRQGFVSAQRFAAVTALPYAAPQHVPNPQLVEYRLRTADLRRTFAEDARLSQAARLVDPPLDPRATVSYTYEALGKPLSGPGALRSGAGPLNTYVLIVMTGTEDAHAGRCRRTLSRYLAEAATSTRSILRVQRYRRSPIQRYSGKPSPPCMVEYTLATDDLAATLSALAAASIAADRREASDRPTQDAYLFKAESPLLLRP